MEYYKKAAEAIRSGEEKPLNLLKNVGLTALGGGAASLGSKAINRLIPAVGALINQYVPENISREGLGRIDPRFNDFIQGAIDQGYSYEDLRNYIGEKIEKSEEQPKQKLNLIEQESPELHQYLDQEIRNGRRPIEAAAIAQHDKRFANIIQKLTKTHKTPWSQIIESIYGTGETAQPTQQTQQPQQGQPGAGQQALMAILDRINQKLGQ